ncbi:MAG: PorT family protein [Pedobacter sp.]|nr:MAG: PorT family protein [Pedobacter sp.]
MKSLLTITLILLCLSSQAQEKKITIDLNAGYVNSKFKLDNTEDFKSSSRSGFYAGFSVNRPFNDKFSLQSGLFLIGKGGKFSENVDFEEDEERFVSAKPIVPKTISQHLVTGNFSRKSVANLRSESKLTSETQDSEDSEFIASSSIDMSIQYIEIPLNATYTLSTNSGQMQIGAGPYYAFAISGRMKSTIDAEEDEEQNSEKLKFGNSADDNFRRHDFGLNFVAGFRFDNKISIKAGYGLGLADIASASSEGSIKNRLFSIGLGYSLK